jgi:DNA polymerase III alpha subunit
MHIGRGSGANSIISYCLGITNICPLELDLYFERFLNLNRKSPPDFDID